ncbi:MAG: hypothetical protein LC541_08585 [Candidatus Thiodiazotropha sp.]|nr:hypothetical protein [Candidatus Thiodiazotropha sp.]MCM8883340.1 hypothetical protein [Candidatus Thiodiazotropha sp.]MCM8920432.1 hypothetical protein [Candidatus Thiodiazotropha sp.]
MNTKSVMASIILSMSVDAGMNAAYAAPQKDQVRDWPCEQIFVPEVAAAVVWAGPPITGLDNEWQQHKGVNDLVQRISAAEADADTVEREVEAFASQQQPQEKDRNLTLLFTGVYEVLNGQRGKMLNGIKRYSQGQAARAERLGEELDEMIRLENDSSQAARDKLRMMQKEMELKQRMFDEREAFIQHLCERPVVVEQRLGMVARTIAANLD